MIRACHFFDDLTTLIVFRKKYHSTIIHENRHIRQSYDMPILQSEIQAFEYQRTYSNRDIQDLIQNALEDKYPLPESRPSNFGIKEVFKYLYEIEN